MSENLFKLWTTQFSTNLELRLQQMGSKLRGKVREGFHVGKQASPTNYISPVQLKAPAGRFAPKNRTDPDFQRRWVFPQDGEIDQLIDSFDELKTIVDPKSQYVTGAANAVGRAWDDCIIAAAFATAQIGQDAGGLSGEAFDTTNLSVASTFGSTAASGLTVAKLIEAKRIFRHNHVDLENSVDENMFLVIGSKQESDLLNQVQVVSTEFNDKPVLVDGKVTRFLGFDIVVSERLTVTSNVRQVIAGVKSGMYLGMWKDNTNRVSIRNDLSGEPYDLYTSTSYGATRLEHGRLVQVLCADTTGADITP
jgi:capsid protein